MRHATILLGLLSVSVGLLGCQNTEPVETEASSTPPPVAYVPEAAALIRVSLIDGNDGQPMDESVFRRYVQTQMELIKSPFALNAALRLLPPSDLEILRDREKPLDWLLNEVKVQSLNNSEIVRISMRGEPEDEIVQVVQAVVEAYLEEIGNMEREERSRALQRVREQQRRLINEIKEKSEKVNALSEQLAVASDAKSDIARQRLKQHAELAHQRIEHLTIRLDELVIQAKAAEIDGDNKAVKRITAQTNAANDLLKTAKSDYEKYLDELSASIAFSAEVEMRTFEIRQLKGQLEGVMSEVGMLERRLSRPPRVTLVQPAIIVEVEDTRDEEESEAGKSEDDLVSI